MNEIRLGKSPLEKHPAHVQAIGMLSIEIGVVELMLGRLLGSLLGLIDDLGEIIYMTPKSYTGRLDILENVAKRCLQPNSEGLSRIQSLVKRTKRRIQYRNDTTHSGWGVQVSDHNIVTRRPFPFTQDSKAEPVLVSDLEAEITKIRQLQADIAAETFAVRQSRAAAVASLNISPEQNQEPRT